MAKANATTTARAKAGTATVKRSKTKTMKAFVKKGRVCPQCASYTVRNFGALSRFDNRTIVCPDCGAMESLMIDRGSKKNHAFARGFFAVLSQFNRIKAAVQLDPISEAIKRAVETGEIVTIPLSKT